MVKVFSICLMLETKGSDKPVILAGDQNVADWSYFTRGRFVLRGLVAACLSFDKRADAMFTCVVAASEILWYLRRGQCTGK